MQYRNTEMKLDQLVTYLNEGKINLSPAFQRGHVWKLTDRKALLKNIVMGRPIPSIFLYKDPQGTRYSYNILDGKQRIESLILFVGTKRKDIQIENWQDYLFQREERKHVSFWVQLPTGKKTFAQLDEDAIRDFREYSIPTIEISITLETTLDEIINLFVDINQKGVSVARFSIVKAMAGDDPLLTGVFELIALQQPRGEDVHYRPKSNEFTSVLKTLTLVGNIKANNARVDRIWERLLEIVFFARTKTHSQPMDALKKFIRVRQKGEEAEAPLSRAETIELRKVFRFLRHAYKTTSLSSLRLATEQTYFYTMITSLIASDLLERYSEPVLTKKLVRFGRIIDGKATMPTEPKLVSAIEGYLEESTKQTTHPSRRVERQRLFIEAINRL